MIEWYNDKNDLTIFFNTIPNVKMRYITPITPKELFESIKKYPFINKKDLLVVIFDHILKQKYIFKISKGYCYDGATIPKLIWSFCGSNTDNKYLIGALIHDVLCENHKYCKNDRKASTRILKALFIKGGTNPIQANIMCFFVDLFQMIFGKW